MKRSSDNLSSLDEQEEILHDRTSPASQEDVEVLPHLRHVRGTGKPSSFAHTSSTRGPQKHPQATLQPKPDFETASTSSSIYSEDGEDGQSNKMVLLDDGDEPAVVQKLVASQFCFGSTTMPTPPCFSRELQRMNPESRSQVDQDVLGITQVAEISDQQLQDLQDAIDSIPTKEAYNLAMELDPHYISNSRLALSFLRSTEGNARQAARRLIRHFDTKLSLWGADKLVKDITLDDFDNDDMEALQSGGFQVLPTKDRAGRPILFGRYTCMKYKTIPNMLRTLWYTWSTIVEDEDHQKSGIIAIGYETGKVPLERLDFAGDDFETLQTTSHNGGFDRELARGILSIPLSLPIRPVGYHITADNSQWQGINDMVMVTVCKFVRLRMRFHYGSHQEVQYALLTHGIPAEAVPVNDQGHVDLTAHYEWIEQRKAIEAARKGASV